MSSPFPTMTKTELESKALCDIGNMPRAKNKVIVLDIEGNSRDVRADPASLTMGLSYAFRLPNVREGLVSGYLPFRHQVGQNLDESYLRMLRDVLRAIPGLRPVAHNFKYDGVGLRNNLGIDLLSTDFYCTMIMAHMINENLIDKGLDYVSRSYGGPGKNKSEAQDAIVKAFGWEYIPVPMMTQYSTQDSESELDLFEKEIKQLNAQGLHGDLWEYEREWMRFIIQMESVGIAINDEMVEKEIVAGELAMAEIVETLKGNPASPKFLSKLLFEDLGLPIVKRTNKGAPSFDKEAMKEYDELLLFKDDPTAGRILEYRGWQKTVSSNYRAYFDLRSPDGYLRPNYKLHGTRTSRLSCEKPNLQQIPRNSPKRWNGNLKKAFVARPGCTLWEFDYGQLELRLAAVYAQEHSLLEAFRRGVNVFDAMSAVLHWPRQDCKTFTYATLYGGGNNRIHHLFGVSIERAKEMRETEFFGAYPRLREISNKASRLAKQRGYIKYWTGRRRHFENPEEDAHKAFNSLVQGGAAELVKRQGIRIGHTIDWDECKVLLQVHDSYVFEIRNGTEEYWIPRLQSLMEDVKTLSAYFAQIPFVVDIKKWGTQEEWTRAA